MNTDAELRARHTCIRDASSMRCSACNAGVPYPHASVDDLIDGIARERGAATRPAIRFFVEGQAIPKGNHTAFPFIRGKCQACRPGKPCRRKCCINGMVIGATVADDGGSELKTWEALVRVRALSARNKLGVRLYETGVAIVARFTFLMQRPKAHYTSTGALSSEGLGKPFPVSRPDFDKLTRAAADGMTGALYADDSQVAYAPIGKLWALNGKPGVVISVEPMERIPDELAREITLAGIQTASAQAALL